MEQGAPRGAAQAHPGVLLGQVVREDDLAAVGQDDVAPVLGAVRATGAEGIPDGVIWSGTLQAVPVPAEWNPQ